MPVPVRRLLVIATPKEAEAVLRGLGHRGETEPPRIEWALRPIGDRFDLVIAGVGKANAAAATARVLDRDRHMGVVSLGVSGALPGSGLSPGGVIDATSTSYADEGSANPDGFRTIAEMGFGPLADLCARGNGMDAMSIPCLPLLERPDAVRGPITTVSTCSGHDSLAVEIARRTGALAEDMESAAVAFAVERLVPGIDFSAIRVISNTTGDRLLQTWNLSLALDRLAEAVSEL